MAFQRYQRATEAVELDLIPVMNLMMVLIPFLLLGASFFHIAVIPASLPSHTPSQEPAEPPIEITVNCAIKPEAVEVTVSSGRLDPERIASLGATFPMRDGNIDAEGIQRHLVQLKSEFTTSDTMIVLPHPALQYTQLVGLLDKTRERETGATDAAGEAVTEARFPVVIFSRFVTENRVDAEGEAPAEEATP